MYIHKQKLKHNMLPESENEVLKMCCFKIKLTINVKIK